MSWEAGKGIPGIGHSRCKGPEVCFVCGLLWLAGVKAGADRRWMGEKSLEDLSANKSRGT